MSYPNQNPGYPAQAPAMNVPPPVGAPGGFPQAPAPQYPPPVGAPGGFPQAPAPQYPPQAYGQAPAPQYPPQAYGQAPQDPAMFGQSAVPVMFAGTTAQEGIDRLPGIALGMSRLQIVKAEWKSRSSSIVVTWRYLTHADPTLTGRECAKVYFVNNTDPKAGQKQAEDWIRMVIKHLGFADLNAAAAAGMHPYEVAKMIALGGKPLDGRSADCNCIFSGKYTRPNEAKGYKGGDPINNQSWAIPNG